MTHRRGGRKGELLELSTGQRRARQIWLGERIREERIAAGFTQASLAKRIGKPQSWLSRVEDGTYVVPGHMLADLARAIGVTVSRLFNEHKQQIETLAAAG